MLASNSIIAFIPTNDAARSRRQHALSFTALVKTGQVLHIGSWNQLHLAARSNPGLHSTFDDPGLAVLLLEHVRHPQAGGVADATAVEINFALRRHELPQC